MGYSDLGAYGGEIATPNIDALAQSGVQFTEFHVAPNCGPTRGAMLTGVDYHRAGLGGNVEVAAENQRGQPAYQGYLRDDVVTMAELLRHGGYHTYMTGKWHLGSDERNRPSGRGFEQSFALMNGGASHWSDQAALIPGSVTRYMHNGQPVSELPDDFYSTTAYTNRMIEFIDENAGDGTPFFGYLAYTAPHNPLHVPAEHIEKHRGRYDGGWDVLAQERVARQRELGLLDESDTPHPRPEWISAVVGRFVSFASIFRLLGLLGLHNELILERLHHAPHGIVDGLGRFLFVFLGVHVTPEGNIARACYWSTSTKTVP